MDYLVDVVQLAVGVAAGYAVRWLSHGCPELPPIPKPLVPVLGPDDKKAYIRFHFADGRVEVRKFSEADLFPHVEWKGRTFEAGEWTPDGHVYREVING